MADAARELAETRGGRIVAAGGDGTLNRVLNGLASHLDDVELGLLPIGTGNDFARSARVPSSLDEAVRLLENGEARPIDAVTARSGSESGETRHWFLNVSSAGFAGRVDAVLDAQVKSTWGPLSYLRAATEEISEMRAYRVRIEAEGTEPRELRAHAVVVANGRRAAAGIPIAPDARIDDGALDVLALPEMEMPELLSFLPRVLAGAHVDGGDVLFLRTSRLRLAAEPAMQVVLDGEPFGETPLEFRVAPGAVRFVTGYS